MVWELQRIDQAFVQSVSEHHLQHLTHMNRSAGILMGEQRTSLITEAIQALQRRHESTAQQIRARDKLNEQLNNQIISLREQTMTELQTEHRQNAQQTPQLRTELTTLTEEGHRSRESILSAFVLVDERGRVAELQQQQSCCSG